MENITKALLITAGVLMAIMLLTLLIIFWGQMSGYFTEKHDAKIIEQTVEFNNRFENYNGQTVRGNEIISVMNRVIDYNNTAAGIEEYDPVTIEIDLKSHNNDISFKYNTSDSSIFASNLLNGKISNADGNDSRLINIANLSTELVNNSGINKLNDTKLQKLSASISIIMDDSEPDYRARTLKNILGYEVNDPITINRIKNATKQYYQYMQFKRAMFECTDVKYNTTNGRVNYIEFIIVEDDRGNVKFN